MLSMNQLARILCKEVFSAQGMIVLAEILASTIQKTGGKRNARGFFSPFVPNFFKPAQGR